MDSITEIPSLGGLRTLIITGFGNIIDKVFYFFKNGEFKQRISSFNQILNFELFWKF